MDGWSISFQRLDFRDHTYDGMNRLLRLPPRHNMKGEATPGYGRLVMVLFPGFGKLAVIVVGVFIVVSDKATDLIH